MRKIALQPKIFRYKYFYTPAVITQKSDTKPSMNMMKMQLPSYLSVPMHGALERVAFCQRPCHNNKNVRHAEIQR